MSARGLHETTHRVGSQALSAGPQAVLPIVVQETVGGQVLRPRAVPARDPHRATHGGVRARTTLPEDGVCDGPPPSVFFLLFRPSQRDVTVTWLHRILGPGAGTQTGRRVLAAREHSSGQAAICRNTPEAHLHGTPVLRSG